MKAIWNNQVIAESEKTQVVEGNHYFPAESIKKEFFSESQTHTTCPYKGVASYYNINVKSNENKDAAWFYPEVKTGFTPIKGYVAFWKGVTVEK
ncbi:DUF427 domain-containing protein [uncultured Flavobacterium sp.]|uniref:DUF427 domain-containing protein n=1 Tax=uncultured Flavobacterium sp. TaxID=165435 RepID=UPI0030ED4E9E|tara:strand:+ start:967 stop:1248 length:282 start_codon:yes stop_codon:yes gene_type:complete